MEIRISDRIKTSGLNKLQPNLVLPTFNDKTICAAYYTLKCYLQRTENLRGNTDLLFISFKRPFAAVGSQTLGRWIKLILNKCRINTDIFTKPIAPDTPVCQRQNERVLTWRQSARRQDGQKF